MTKSAPYYTVLAIWLSLAMLSACSPAPPLSTTLKLQPQSHISGLSSQETLAHTPLAAITFNEQGFLLTLAQDSCRITVFDKNGNEKMSCAVNDPLQVSDAVSADGLALGTDKEHIYALTGMNRQIQTWRADGELQEVTPITVPLSPGDVAFGRKGTFYHSTEGLSDDSLIVAIDRHGKLAQKVGQINYAEVLQPQQDSIRQALARGQVPAFLQNSVLVATGADERLYALHRTRPLLKCFKDGTLLFEKSLHVPEMEEIRHAVQVRNRLLEVPTTYIPLSYWADMAVAEDGSLYVLLAMQTHHTLYRLDRDGSVLSKLVGGYGKGHLLAVDKNRLAIADAAKGEVTFYTLPTS